MWHDFAALQHDVYPSRSSEMFNKMYLNDGVRTCFIKYDVLAIIEWDILVTSERSFEQLYHSTFQELQDAWVKGSHMEGADVHSNVEIEEM